MDTLEKLEITQKDFKDALKVVRPSAMREVLVEIPNVKWTDIGGLEKVKQELVEAVEWPFAIACIVKNIKFDDKKIFFFKRAPYIFFFCLRSYFC